MGFFFEKKQSGQAFAIKKIQDGSQEEKKARTRPAAAEKGNDRKKVCRIVKLLPRGAMHDLMHYCTRGRPRAIVHQRPPRAMVHQRPPRAIVHQVVYGHEG